MLQISNVWICKKCGSRWYYDVGKCVYCGSEIEVTEPGAYTVKGITKVLIPSVEHPDVPYYDLLLEDEHGNLHILKTSEKYEIGSIISRKGEKGIPRKIGIIGTGIMGVGIASVALQFECEVILKSRSDEALGEALKKIENYLLKTVDIKEKDRILGNIKPTTDFDDIKYSDIVIECVVEDLEIKKQVFKELDEVCLDKTVLATNTSSLSIDDLASVISDPSRFVGMHFFNPVSKMRLVEIVRGKNTSKKTIELVMSFVEQLNKIPILVSESPGFIVNRIIMPYLNEAAHMLEQETATAEDIDTAAKLGLNLPMGPLALLDLIGLDTFLAIMKNLYKRTGDAKYKPCSLIEKMVKNGRLGQKTKQGFFKY